MSPATIDLHYCVSMENPAQHLFQVQLEIDNWQATTLDLKMPVWTPGSYLVREYARHLQNFTAKSSDNELNLKHQKISKNHWQIETNQASKIIIYYEIYANDLTVRTNHLDDTHGFFTGAALFFYLPEQESLPIKVTIEPPSPHWQITTSLQEIKEETNTFIAPDFDTLVDSPFEIGIQKKYDFQVANKAHQWVIWGEGNLEIERVIADTKKIISTEAQLFGDLPYDNYFFLLHLSASGFGGLEHKNCCVLNYPRFGFQKAEKYTRFMQLVAHEFFHLWNVKRIRPQGLEKFDYEQENYTASLWFCEGVTSYYDMLIPYRAKIYDRQKLLKLLSKDLNLYLNIGGRKIQPLAESSFDAWIKLYRRDAYSNNNQISYYLKGQFVTLLLDLIIRNKTKNNKSFDDVMRSMWTKFGKQEIGFSPAELVSEIESTAQTDLSDFFNLYLHTTAELPLADYLEPFGIQVKADLGDDPAPYLGITLQTQQSQEKITFVDANSPAGKVGIDAGDELLAINGFKVTSDNLADRLRDYQSGEIIKVTIFHEEQLKTIDIELATAQPSSYELKIMDDLTPTQKENLDKWL